MEDLWVWTLVLATPFAIIYVLTLSKWRFSKSVTIIFTCVFICVVTAFNFVSIRDMFWMINERPILDLACRLLNISLEAAFAIIITKQLLVQTAFIVLSMCLCVYIVDAVAIAIDYFVGSNLLSFIFKLSLYLIMTAALYRLRKAFWEVALYMKNRLWTICMVQAVLFICSTMVVSFPVPLNLAPSNIPLALTLALANVGVYGIFLYIFRLVHRQTALENNAEAFHIYAASLEHQNQLIRKNSEKAALFRHDIRHVSQMMSHCAERGDIEGVKELIKLLDKNVGAEAGLFVAPITGHRLIDTVFSSYISLAREGGIMISVNVAGIEAISADPAEFAVVLANALENALHACKNQPEGEERLIKAAGRKQGKQFFFEIANTFSGSVDFDPVTGLPTTIEEGHGTGSKSIAYFAEKHGALMRCTAKNGWFRLSLLINTCRGIQNGG